MKFKLIIVLIAFVFSMKTYANEITFENGTFNEVLSKAKTGNKVLMIDFFTDWCKWCVELDKKVYTNPDVADFANQNQINWKIDAEKGEGIALAKKYQVSGFPTIVFVNGDGEEIDRIVGYIPAKDFLVIMKDYNAGKNTMNSLKKTLESNQKDIEANFKIGKKIADGGNMEEAKKYFEKVISLDPNNSAGWTDDAELYIAQINNKKEDIEAFVKKYPDSDLAKSAYMYLAETSLEGNDYAKADEYYKLLFAKYGKTDEEINFGYGQYMLTKMYSITKNTNAKAEDYKKGIEYANECLEFVKGSVNESSCYFYISEFYLKLGDKQKANESIDKALLIHDKKSFRDQKEKINK